MSSTPTQELIDSLRRSVSRWKAIALTLLLGVALLIVLGTARVVVQVQRVKAARQAEVDARQRAEEAAEQAARNLGRTRQAVDALQNRVIEDALAK